MNVVHRFVDDLDYSNDLSQDEGAWVQFYKRVWPDVCSILSLNGQSQWQKWGIDREVKLRNGRQFTIDEKKRRKDYGDIALEIFSQWYGKGHPKNKIGWTRDVEKRCDFVAYAVVPARRCYLLPTEILRLACERNWQDWIRRKDFPVVKADNESNGHRWQTINIGVKWDVLSAAMKAEMSQTFTSELCLPEPTVNGSQLEFRWCFEE